MRVHFISIGGAIMHQLAIALQAKGFSVSGSDDAIYDPSKSTLAAHGLLPKQMGWNAKHITDDLDAVILGMHARADNPELQAAKEKGIKIYSFPEYIFEQSKEKTRVVVGGSHGKTTTTSMIMHVLRHAQMEFDYLVGAALDGFPNSVKLTDAPIILLEGDEYLASPINRQSKFHFYHPQIALLTGIAWDHINVFPTFESYLATFETFIKNLEGSAQLFYFEKDEYLPATAKKHANSEAYNTPNFSIENGKVCLATTENESIALEIIGKHNLQNLAGAKLVCTALGVSEAVFYAAMASFSGAKKRLECVKADENTLIYRDFAHAPSKVKATVEAVADTFLDKKIVAVYELHTFSSLNADFLPQYAQSLAAADEAIVLYSKEALRRKKMPILSPEHIFEAFGQSNLEVLESGESLKKRLLSKKYHNSVLLLMSSGHFDGLDIAEVVNFAFQEKN